MNALEPHQEFQRVWLCSRLKWVLGVILLSWFSVSVSIEFEEVTESAGIEGKGVTFGSSWGDFDGDSFPDIWVGNHYETPSLYLNNGDGTFTNIIDEVWRGELSDTHGAAWADFDNDGDQDLVETTGAQFGKGQRPSHLYINTDGRLVDQAERLGVQQPKGRGRTPIWLDADRDGQLDLIFLNAPRADGRGKSSLFLQTDSSFVDASKRLGFEDPSRSRIDKLQDMLVAARNFRFGVPPIIYGRATFGQLADLTGNNRAELLAFSPLRIYDLDDERFRDITYTYEFERITGIRDSAVADFDNDGDMDIYLVRGDGRSGVAMTGRRTLRAAMLGGSIPDTPQILVFEGGDALRLAFVPWSVDPSDVLIGGERRSATERTLTLSGKGAATEAGGWSEPKASKVTIEHDPESRRWRIVVMGLSVYFEIQSDEPVSIIEGPEGSDGVGGLADVLLLQEGRRLVSSVPYSAGDVSANCHSVVAEDFDNDGDSDIYLVCTGSVINEQNVLLENNGLGHFAVIPDAGGAGGSSVGRGDVVTSGDYDGDGHIDLFVTNGDGQSMLVTEGPHQLFHNKGSENNWLQIELRGAVSNRDGIGSRIVLESAGKRQIRDQGGGMHKYAQNFDRVHFGLAKADTADKITVYWPSGMVQTLKDVPANQVIIVTEE